MPKTRQQKEETVTKLKEKLGRAKSVVFADFRGLTMKQLSDLRGKLGEQGAEFTVTKNTLLKLALQNLEFRSAAGRLFISNFEFSGPMATLLAYDDEISPIKILVKALKDAGLGKVKMGFLGADILDEAKILKLALLPGKDELYGQTVGILAAPLQGMVSVLQGNLKNLLYAISEIQKMKGGVAYG